MSTIIKQGLKGTIFSYLGILLGYANWVLLIPLFLNKEEMGLVRVLMDAAVLLATIFGLGIPQTVIKFYPYGNDGKFSRNFFATFGLITLFAGLLFIPIYFIFETPFKAFFADKAPLFNEYSWALVPIIFFTITFDLFDALNKIRLNISASIFIKEVLFRILTLASIVGYGLHLYSFDILIFVLIACYALQAINISIVFFAKWNPDQSSLRPSRPTKENFKYMLFLFLGSGGAVLVTQIDSIMTGGMKGLDYAAVYAMAVFMASVVYIPFRTLTSITSSMIAKHFSENKLVKIDKMYKSSSINLFLIGGAIFLAIWWNVDFIFSLIPEKNDSAIRFADGKWVLFILGIARLIDMITGLNGIILVNSRYYYMHFITMPILAVIAIILNLLLIPPFEIIGAALGALFSIFIFNAMRYIILWYKLKMQPFTLKSFILILIFSLTLLCSFIIQAKNPLLQILFSVLVICITYVLPAYLFKLSPEINKLASGFIEKYKPKRKD